MLLLNLHPSKTHAPIFNITIQQRPPIILHAPLQSEKHKLKTFFRKGHGEQQYKHLKFVVNFIKCPLFLLEEFLFGAIPP